MTLRQVYTRLLIEINKVAAPSLLLEDFNYLLRKSIYQYVNKQYNICDTNQQADDNIRVLKSTAILQPKLATETYTGVSSQANSLYGAVYEVNLPLDYLHILNCICNYKVHRHACYKNDTYIQYGAIRLTSNTWSQVFSDYYMRPSYNNPYFYIHNVNTSNSLPSNPITATEPISSNTTIQQTRGTDGLLPTKITIGGKSVDLINKPAVNRYGNASQVRMEIRYGRDNSIYELTDVFVDYIKTPQHLVLTQEQIDLTDDTSQVLEFPDYVCLEIINELTKLFLENNGDPRLNTNIPVNQSIAPPAQAGTPKK